jgi:hypothetical protein
VQFAIRKSQKQFTEEVQGVSLVTKAFDSAKDIKAPKQARSTKKLGKFGRLDESLDDDLAAVGESGAGGWDVGGFGGDYDFSWGGGGDFADGVGYYDFEDDDKDDGNTWSNAQTKIGRGMGAYSFSKLAEISVDFRATPGHQGQELPQGLEVVNSKGVNLTDLKVRVLVRHGAAAVTLQPNLTQSYFVYIFKTATLRAIRSCLCVTCRDTR